VPSGAISIRTSRAQPEGSRADGASRLGMDGNSSDAAKPLS
jgi:hypothetical protein